MYESVHEDGTPIYDSETIESVIRDFREWLNHEVDTIRSATSEYRDAVE
jgi:hypothetical protein